MPSARSAVYSARYHPHSYYNHHHNFFSARSGPFPHHPYNYYSYYRRPFRFGRGGMFFKLALVGAAGYFIGKKMSDPNNRFCGSHHHRGASTACPNCGQHTHNNNVSNGQQQQQQQPPQQQGYQQRLPTPPGNAYPFQQEMGLNQNGFMDEKRLGPMGMEKTDAGFR